MAGVAYRDVEFSQERTEDLLRHLDGMPAASGCVVGFIGKNAPYQPGIRRDLYVDPKAGITLEQFPGGTDRAIADALRGLGFEAAPVVRVEGRRRRSS